ncbi:MAG: hypothetical protein AAF720_01410 [Pseudomonadota bacterium]
MQSIFAIIGAMIILACSPTYPQNAEAATDTKTPAIVSETPGESAEKAIVPEAPETKTRKEAYRASTGKIVLHYGEGILDADLVAESLVKRSYPALVFAGGPENQVEMFIDRKPAGKFTQRDLNLGDVGGLAISLFDEHVGKPE